MHTVNNGAVMIYNWLKDDQLRETHELEEEDK